MIEYRPLQKIVPYRSKEFLHFIDSMGCMIHNTDATHHHIGFGNKGTSTKPPDIQVVPLCPTICHDIAHSKEGIIGVFQSMKEPGLSRRIQKELIEGYLAKQMLFNINIFLSHNGILK